MGGLECWGVAAAYGVLVLWLSSKPIGGLLAALGMAQLLAVLVFALGDRPGVGSLGLAMSTGVIVAVAVRSLRGLGKPLRGENPD